MEFNPLTPEFRSDPYPLLKRLRDAAPVGEIEGFGVFYVSRHADVIGALKRPQVFSSEGMKALQGSTLR